MPFYDLNDYDALAEWLEPRRHVILTSPRKDGSPRGGRGRPRILRNDSAGAGGADGKTLFMEQERQRRAAEAKARREAED